MKHDRQRDLQRLLRFGTVASVFVVLLALALAGLWAGQAGQAHADDPALSDAPAVASSDAPAAAPRVASLAKAQAADPARPQSPAFGPPPPEPAPEVARGTIPPGGSLAVALTRKGISPQAIQAIATNLKPVFDFRYAKPGDEFSLVHHDGSEVLEFRYTARDHTRYLLRRDDDGFVATSQEPEVIRHTARIAGVVTSSLYDAIRQLGEQPKLASDFAELLAWDVDFSRSVQPGDEFSILYERLFRRGAGNREVYTGPGRILAARYIGQSGEHRVVYFDDESGHHGYYRPDGTSVEREFLIAPLKYSRISSRYTQHRLHPILNITRPHLGIDYAAPYGTPIFAVAGGEVIYAGWAGGFGNLVKIRHPNGYISYYGHMSRFAKGLRVGQEVNQKQVIGYVGQTGLATGPHVCFRIRKDGHYVNPAKLKTPAGDPIPKAEMAEFSDVRDALFAQLAARPMVATDEAL